jgi:hypothetical protein
MAGDEDQAWSADDTDPFGEPLATREADVPSEPATSEESSEGTHSQQPGAVGAEGDPSILDEAPDVSGEEHIAKQAEWGLPIRAAPLLADNDETVQEYPLKQSADGRSSTSIVIDDEIVRVVDTELGVDNHRRMKVGLTVKRDITGFSHQHNELMHQHQFLWIGCVVLGFITSLFTSIAFGVLGALLVIIGVRSWILMHLETHSIAFSNQGGSHELVLRGYGTNRGFFRASMAMIGPTMANFIRNGVLDTEELEALHASLLEPAIAPAPHNPLQVVQVPYPSTSAEEIQLPTYVSSLPTPPPQDSDPSVSMNPITTIPSPPVGPPSTIIPSAPVGPPMNIPPPPTIPSLPTIPVAVVPPTQQPLPLPIPSGPPVAMTTPSPITLPLPPAPLPPMPLSSALAPSMAPLPMPPQIPAPLDAPLPNAPEILVEASPIEETLSEDEQNELLNELS